jgi:hypothetical protein
MNQDGRPETLRQALTQGALSLALLTIVLLLINRFVRDFPWDESLWRTLQFAIPFVVVYTALQVVLARRRGGR